MMKLTRLFLLASVFLGLFQVAFAQDSMIALPTDALAVGETKIIDVSILCSAVDCAAIDITIQYDPAIIQVNSAEAGPFWSQTGNTVFPIASTIDPAAGTVRFASVTVNMGNPGVTGSGSAVRLNVTGLAEGSSPLNVTNLKIGSLSGVSISSAPANGSLSVTGDDGTVAFRIQSDATTYNVGDIFTVRVNANNLSDVYGLALNCNINKGIIAGQSVVLGDLFDPVNNLPVNNTHQDDNSWDFGGSQRNPAPAISGSGLAFTLTFQAVSPGTAQIDCEPLASDRTGHAIEIGFSGMSITVGNPTDTDGDGVPDDRDQCPTEGVLGSVDANGCPMVVDTDGDGVPDDIDQCPTEGVLGNVDANGCPIVVDTDGDGVPDNIDQCPTEGTLGNVDANGCPIVVDTDGDGVPDNIDQCPTEGTLGNVDANGCPIVVDTDGDGVPDNIDQCPTEGVLGNVDANGCPVSQAGRIVSLINDLPAGTTVRVVNTADNSEQTVSITGDGQVIIADIVPGTYDVYASAPQHLTAKAGAIVVTADQDAILGPVTLVNGDVDNNGSINIDDVVLVNGSYNLQVPPASEAFDLNKNGKIDIFDVTIVGGNWDGQAPTNWQ